MFRGLELREEAGLRQKFKKEKKSSFMSIHLKAVSHQNHSQKDKHCKNENKYYSPQWTSSSLSLNYSKASIAKISVSFLNPSFQRKTSATSDMTGAPDINMKKHASLKVPVKQGTQRDLQCTGSQTRRKSCHRYHCPFEQRLFTTTLTGKHSGMTFVGTCLRQDVNLVYQHQARTIFVIII